MIGLPRVRPAAAAAILLSVLVALSTGCGLISGVKNFASKVGVLTDLSSKLKDSEKRTFTAVYAVSGHSAVTIANQPPRTAVRSGTTAFLSLPEGNYLCQISAKPATCEKTPAAAGVGSSAAALGTGQGFVSPQIAIAVLTAAAVFPSAKVEESTRTIAGRSATCAKVTGLKDIPVQDNVTISEFTVCITDDGALGAFDGSLSNGKTIKTELSKYSTTVAPSAFALPPHAKIVNLSSPPA